MKKLIFVICICIISLLSVNVNAKEIYYSNGTVNLTKKEYDYVKEFYGEKYLANMDKEDYLWLADLDVNNREVEIKKSNDSDVFLPNDTSVASSNKQLAISKACAQDFCVITVYVTWLGDPTVRSYDVIGARFDGTSLYSSTMGTRVGSTDDNTSKLYSNYQNFDEGFGNSVKLPDKSSCLYVEQRYYVKQVGNGVVYASYQHAMRNTTLDISKSYYISIVGYGRVFVFTGKAVDLYDGFAGVDIRV